MSLPEINEIGEKVKHWQAGETRYFRNLPLKNYVYFVLALFGMFTTWLPWADVTVGFYNKAMAVGLYFFPGWLVFLCFLTVAGVSIFNKHIKIKEKYAVKVPAYAAIISTALITVFLIWKLFNVRYGILLCSAASLALLFFVWYYDKKEKQR
ncbi:MAG: hypothetical protein PHR81_02990 [Bacteroidales bacterium]|nr:hypothetical protein [Bacteroidales bacterium]MDD4213755.1 hypothetical protein [Bacteroidales bacterium]